MLMSLIAYLISKIPIRIKPKLLYCSPEKVVHTTIAEISNTDFSPFKHNSLHNGSHSTAYILYVLVYLFIDYNDIFRKLLAYTVSRENWKTYCNII